MSKSKDWDKFANELDALIHRWRHESDITFAEAVGAIEFVKAKIIKAGLEAPIEG